MVATVYLHIQGVRGHTEDSYKCESVLFSNELFLIQAKYKVSSREENKTDDVNRLTDQIIHTSNYCTCIK